MKESEIKDNESSSLTCSICHQKIINIKKDHNNLKKLFNNNLKDSELLELIKKCKCINNKNINDIQNNENYHNGAYSHKLCIILKILFNFELKCEKCNTLYNIQVNKEIDLKKKIFLFAVFSFIYIIHIVIYLFCLFLLFIKIVLKENVIIIYNHLPIFFSIILLIINSILLNFTIKENKEKFKYNIYRYSINIFDINTKYNNNCCTNKENEFFNLIYEFYQYFYKNSMKNLLPIINKKFIINKLNYLYNKSIKDYFNKNNIDILAINKIPKINSSISYHEKLNANLENSKEIMMNNDNNLNLFKLNSKSIHQESDIISYKSNNSKNIFNFNNNSNMNNYLVNKSIRDEKYKLKPKDYIKININPVASNNININIHFSTDKNSIIDHSSSKEKTFQSNKLFKKIGKTALIPKNLTMSNIISEANSFKRKQRVLRSIKIKENKLKLKGTNITGNITEDEEIDFSEFDKMDSKISKESKNNNFISTKNNNFELKYIKLRAKKSFGDVDLNFSNSDVGGQGEINNNQNFRGSLKSVKNMSGKHVHFANINSKIQSNKES